MTVSFGDAARFFWSNRLRACMMSAGDDAKGDWFMHYTKAVSCGAPGCGHPAEFKVAAPWSYGRFTELKTYGLACAAHRDQTYQAAVARGQKHPSSSEEKVGEIGVYRYEKGLHDRDLEKVGSTA